MQLSLDLCGPSPLVAVDHRLRAAYGPPPEFWRIDPVSQLVQSLLSSKTLDAVSTDAFLALAEYFKGDCDAGWERLRDALPAAIYPLIRAVHHAEVKAVQLPRALELICARRGALDLDFLAGYSVEAAQRWLLDLPGVGPKVAAAVLNFSWLGHRSIVYDSHCLRVAERVGLLSPGHTDKTACRIIERQLPDAWTADDLGGHHWLMKTHGQRRCPKVAPLCAGCPLDDLCAHRKSARQSPARR